MQRTQDTILTQEEDSAPIVFSQYAQDWSEVFREAEEVEEEESELVKKIKLAQGKPKTKKAKGKVINKIVKRSLRGHPPTFVINNESTKGSRLIKIQIIDISETKQENEESNENIILNAQYVASDGYDEIIESTESVINKISKKLCGYSVGY